MILRYLMATFIITVTASILAAAWGDEGDRLWLVRFLASAALYAFAIRGFVACM